MEMPQYENKLQVIRRAVFCLAYDVTARPQAPKQVPEPVIVAIIPAESGKQERETCQA